MISKLKNINIVKDIVSSTLLAILVTGILTTFVVEKVEVKADVLNEYPVNSTLFVNKLDKTVSIGDIIVVKIDGNYFIRKVSEINNNQLIISDKDNNTLTVSQDNVIGTIAFKLF